MRRVRVAFMTATLWFALAWVSTKHAPIVDCYERAIWNGKTFTHTGETICLH